MNREDTVHHRSDVPTHAEAKVPNLPEFALRRLPFGFAEQLIGLGCSLLVVDDGR